MQQPATLTYSILFLGALFLLVSCGVSKSLRDTPDISVYESDIPKRVTLSDSSFTQGSDFLTKNAYGQWELFVSGNPMEIGLKTGSLTRELFQYQERVFVDKINELVPSEGKQKLLKKFLAWYNRKMYQHVDERFKTEIYGISQYASDNYNYIAEPYPRVLYFHGAHDIGHALQDLALVGCSSFATWGENSEDGKILIGRNFDFYAGDSFAENKIIAFVSPDEGHNFMSVTWGGFIGVVSGMNDQGLTATINAGKSSIPVVAKTPISILTREILQFASTIEEAIAIAKSREVFVSESIFVGSAKDGKAAIIEVSPKKFGVYEVENSNQLVCSNHFQSAAYANDKDNTQHILESHSQYRFERMEELLSKNPKLNPKDAVALLRNKEGLDDKPIGYGNEKALNQLLAHHGIVFQPEDLNVWVSSNPYQLGEFVGYDLNTIFKEGADHSKATSLANPEITIKMDPFLRTETFEDYQHYRKLALDINSAIKGNAHLTNAEQKEFIASNPEFWEVHYLIGVYNYNKGYEALALRYFETAKEKEITTVQDMERVDKYIRKINRG